MNFLSRLCYVNEVRKLLHINQRFSTKSGKENCQRSRPMLDLATKFYSMAQKNVILNTSQLEDFSKELQDAKGLVKQKNIGTLMYGLCKYSSKDTNIDKLLQVIITKINMCNETFAAATIGMSLYGLKGFDSESPTVRLMLQTLNRKFQKSNEVCNSRTLSSALFGMQRQSSDYIEVQDILHTLNIKLQKSDYQFHGQEIGNSLYGMKCMSNQHNVVRDILDTLKIKIEDSKSTLTPQNISNAFFGLQNCMNDDHDIEPLVKLLTTKLEKCCAEDQSFGRKSIASCLYGIQNMYNNIDKDRNKSLHYLLEVLNKRIQQTNESFYSVELSSSFYGIKNICPVDNPILLALIASLAVKLEENSYHLNAQSICSIFAGMSLCFSHFLGSGVITRQTGKPLEGVTPNITSNFQDGVKICQDLLHTLVIILKSNVPIDVRMIPKSQTDELTLKSIEISTILYSVRNISYSNKDLKMLLWLMNAHIRRSLYYFHPRTISRCFAGIKILSYSNGYHKSDVGHGLNSITVECSNLYEALTYKLKYCKEDRSPIRMFKILQNLDIYSDYSSNVVGFIATELMNRRKVSAITPKDESSICIDAMPLSPPTASSPVSSVNAQDIIALIKSLHECGTYSNPSLMQNHPHHVMILKALTIFIRNHHIEFTMNDFSELTSTSRYLDERRQHIINFYNVVYENGVQWSKE